ncbi:hypothetical protein [Roseivivax sp. CAU 1753]
MVMMRASFDKDIAALSEHTGLGFVIVRKGFVRFQQIFLPSERREQTYYQTATKPFSGDRDPQAIYAAELLDQARRHAPIVGVLSANIDYWQDVGLKYQCRRQNLVFGVLCRENAVIPKIVALNYARYADSSYRFDGDFVVMAGQISAQMLRDAGVANPDRIYATGLPRYDVWHTTSVEQNRQYITLLTFSKGYRADHTFQEVLDIFIQSATSCTNSDLTFLIKTKDAEDTRRLKNTLRRRMSPNVVIDDKIPMTRALSRSRIILGYNSLSLIDALLSGAKIILPGWGECLTTGELCMYPKNERSERFFTYADTAATLIRLLKSATVEAQPCIPPSKDMLAYIQQYVTYDPERLNGVAFAEIACDYAKKRQLIG